jgi:hypothetical protein
MKENLNIDINSYSSILEQITPFVELDDKQYGYNYIKLDPEYIKGGLLGWMGVDITKYRHLVIVSNNPFLGDNLTLILPVVKYFKDLNLFKKIDIYLPYSTLFKSDSGYNFIDHEDYYSIQTQLTKNTLVIAFSLIEGELKEMIKSLNSDVLIGLNDKYTKWYNSGKLIKTMTCRFFDSHTFSEDYTEGIRNQLNLNSKYRKNLYYNQRELLEMVKLYFHRTKKNWENHAFWGKIFNEDFSGANDALYSNVYEYDIWVFKLLLGEKFKWINFLDLLSPKDFTYERNEKLSAVFSPFVLVNINLNTAKLVWQNSEAGIIQYMSSILKDSNENKYKVVFTHPAFDDEVNKSIYELLLNYHENALILSPDDLIDWIPLMKKAQSIVSFDTGFVHLAYLYNSKVLSVGGQSFFWHFPDTEYINFNHIDNQGNVNSDVFYESLNKVLNWIKND